MFFIKPKDVPIERRAKITYPKFICTERPTMAERYRMGLTVGGDRINYPGEVSTYMADLQTVKSLLNITVSTPGARFLIADIKDFFLNAPMERFEYMRIPLRLIPAEIILQYNLREKE